MFEKCIQNIFCYISFSTDILELDLKLNPKPPKVNFFMHMVLDNPPEKPFNLYSTHFSPTHLFQKCISDKTSSL